MIVVAHDTLFIFTFPPQSVTPTGTPHGYLLWCHGFSIKFIVAGLYVLYIIMYAIHQPLSNLFLFIGYVTCK